MWIITIIVITTSVILYQFRESWQESYTKESNYYAIRVVDEDDVKVLYLDRLVHSYVIPDDPTAFRYGYLRTFSDIVGYVTAENRTPSVLHLGGGGYSFPRYMEVIYPGSINEVVEIDPAVTEVAYEELGLPRGTSIKTYNQDARLFLIQRNTENKYNIVIGDVFNDLSTPYHLTTLEFDKLVKANMEADGIYLVNIVDDYLSGRYMPSFTYTLQHAFTYVYLFGTLVESTDSTDSTDSTEYARRRTFVIAATDRQIDFGAYSYSYPLTGAKLSEYLAKRKPLLLTDDYAPTDILVAPLFR
jgi:spermidine synthase